MDQAGSSVGVTHTHRWVYAAGTVAVLGALEGGTIVADRLFGARPVSLVAEVVATGAALAFLFSRDASAARRRDRSAAENARLDAVRREQEAAELGEAIRGARHAQVQADEANRAKTDFLACMSHEIRTPLNSVIGFAALLLQQPDLAPKARLFGERIQSGGAALLTIVDDILDFSQVEAGVITLASEPFSLHGLVDECISLVQHAAAAKQLSLQVGIVDRLPPFVLGDAARLRQVLLNLLNNAIKFTEVGSVTLELRRDRASGDDTRVMVSVIDTGIGIAREDQSRLFQRFVQVDASVRRTHGGTGLGLVICRRLVELMGGAIGVESRKGEGSTFFFSVPLPLAARPANDVAERRTTAGRPLHLLLVEDVALNQELVCQILGLRGHVVDVVGNGAEAVMAVQDTKYDLVLMDVQMPFLDGLAATRMIRALSHPCRDVPIVAMTANVLPEQTAAARAAGMVDVIHKPFSCAEVLGVVNRVVSLGDEVGPTAVSARWTDTDASDSDAGVHDGAILGKLATLLGDAKTRSLLQGLVASLDSRFLADAQTEEGRTELRRQAHASVAGSGMLGFPSFSKACKAFQVAPDDDTFLVRLAALRSDAEAVQAAATRLIEQSEGLVAASAA